MTRQEDELEALYAELPSIECRGSCWDSCGRIGMTGLEHRRVAAAGVDIPEGRTSDPPAVCKALTMLHQCSVYSVRPLICRLWGLTEGLPCTFGCRPTRLLTDAETYEYLARAHDIAGEHDEAEAIRRPWREQPERAAQLMRQLRAKRADEALAESLRRKRAIDNGSAIFVRGYGQISKEPPGRGANSS